MIEHTDVRAEFCEIEEMIRAAGGYLEVSDDLRPRTLEEARDDGRETSARCWIAVLAVVVLLLAMLAKRIPEFASFTPRMAAVSVDGEQLYAAAQQDAAQANVEASWSLVDAFSELRQRQFSLIKEAF